MEKWYNSDFGWLTGVGILILCACLGIGTCGKMLNESNKQPPYNQSSAEKVEEKK